MDGAECTQLIWKFYINGLSQIPCAEQSQTLAMTHTQVLSESEGGTKLIAHACITGLLGAKRRILS